VGECGVRRMALVHFAAQIYTVVTYRIIYFVAVEVDPRLNPIVVSRGFHLHGAG